MTKARSTFYEDLTQQLNVIGALAMRELHGRFGRNNIGYLWMVGEPLMLATVIGGLHLFQAGHAGSTMPPVGFSLVGYCVFIIFRGIFNRSEGLLEGNMSLMYHRMISVLNISLARVVIEAAGCVTTFVLLYSLAILTGYTEPVARPLYAIGGVAAMIWISFAWGLNVIWITHDRPTLGRLVHPISYFMMPLSGSFYAVEWIPTAVQRWADWFPLVNVFEITRYGMFENASDRHLFPGYLIASCAFYTYSGLLGIRRVRNRVHLN